MEQAAETIETDPTNPELAVAAAMHFHRLGTNAKADGNSEMANQSFARARDILETAIAANPENEELKDVLNQLKASL